MKIQATDLDVLEMGKLAVLASASVGMGHLSHDPSMKKDDIALAISDDFNPGLFIDYYQGRMVKFRAWKHGDEWEFPDTISAEYESWIGTYRSYQALFEAATKVVA